MTTKNIFLRKKHAVGEKIWITNKRTGQVVEAIVIRDYGDPATAINGALTWRNYYQVEFPDTETNSN